jgi:transglutaminase-like putative cysteine protease
MRTLRISALLTALFLAATCLAIDDVVQQANQLEESGDFKSAAARLSAALKRTSLSAAERRTLAFELDRLDRIKKDFSYTKESLFAELKKAVKDLTPEEYEQWIAEGRFDTREIDGRRFFMGSSVSNLFFRHPELNARRQPPRDTSAVQQANWEACDTIRKAAQAELKPYVLPKRFRVTMTVTAKADAAPDGETIRAWLPIPRSYPFQTDFKLLNTSSPVKHLEPENSPIRSAFLEQPARKGAPTEFKLEYEYTVHGVWFDVRPEAVKACDPRDPELSPYLREAPHVVFTPEIRALSERIVGTEKNPYLIAKKFHDWIGENIQYSYAIEYSTIRNISQYCLSRGYGDCGQEALLFITLCRLNGIPARWQSGWNTFPGAKTIHDWTEIYIAPYGWMPVDPYKAIFAMRYADALTPEQRRDIRDFYFGGLDWYRIGANSDHNQSLTPPKNSFRSDDVDFQRGELEYGDTNLYFDKYTYSLQWVDVNTGETPDQPSRPRTFQR